MPESLAKQWLDNAEARKGRPLVPPYARDEIISVMESFERYVLKQSGGRYDNHARHTKSLPPN